MRQLIKVYLFTVACIFGLNGNLVAQKDTVRKNKLVGMYFTLPLEFPVIDNGAFNNELNSAGFPSANHASVVPGFGFQLYVNRFISSVTYNRKTKKTEQDNFRSDVKYQSFAFNVGYSFIKSKWYSFYPYLGIKRCRLNYLYRESFFSQTAFANYLNTDLKYKEIQNSRYHADLGIGISHQWFYLINFRFGYLLPLQKGKWKINNNDIVVTNSPSINYKYYFSVVIGLGNIGSNKEFRRYRIKNNSRTACARVF